MIASLYQYLSLMLPPPGVKRWNVATLTRCSKVNTTAIVSEPHACCTDAFTCKAKIMLLCLRQLAVYNRPIQERTITIMNYEICILNYLFQFKIKTHNS